jgi:DNA polymerase eta
MQAKFGEESIWVYNIIRGIDHSEVKEKLANKSMLASKNTNPPVRKSAEAYHWLGVLAGELNVRLREAREATPGLWPKTLVLSTRNSGEAGRSRQAPFPFTRDLSPEYIVKHARKLWDEAMGTTKGYKLSNIGISFTGLEKLEEGQRGIEGFFSVGATSALAVKRPREREDSVDVVPNVEPEAKRRAAPTAEPRTALDAFLARGSVTASDKHKGQSPVPDVGATESEAPTATADTPTTDDGVSWSCPKCDKVLSAPSAEYLAHPRQEHEDYHFALDLQATYGTGPSTPVNTTARSTTTRPAPSRPKNIKKPAGIKAFFAPK